MTTLQNYDPRFYLNDQNFEALPHDQQLHYLYCPKCRLYYNKPLLHTCGCNLPPLQPQPQNTPLTRRLIFSYCGAIKDLPKKLSSTKEIQMGAREIL